MSGGKALQRFVQCLCILLIATALPTFAKATELDFALLSQAPLSIYDVAHTKQEQQKTRLELEAHLPEKVKVAEQDIAWHIYSRQQELVRKLQGNKQYVDLAPSTYMIELIVGHFSTRKQVLIKEGRTVRPYFYADIGRLEVLANQNVDWTLRNQHGKVFQQAAKRYVTELVPAGAYIIEGRVNHFPVRKRVFVGRGQSVDTKLEVPIARINLMAVQDNNPLFKTVNWQVFRLEQGKRQLVGRYHRHARTITVPPGQYEVVATHADKTRKQRFWVQTDTNNKVVLAMD